MKREPSTLFAPGPLSGPGSFELLSMSPDIQALYDAAQRSTPCGTDVDQVLAQHRQAFGEPEQIKHAQRVDPSDAMPTSPRARRQAYARQRRYAVRTGTTVGLPPPPRPSLKRWACRPR